jgi:hypothetical protein
MDEGRLPDTRAVPSSLDAVPDVTFSLRRARITAEAGPAALTSERAK